MPVAADSAPSIWPETSLVRDTALLLVGLVLVAALADGDLVMWLSGALILLFALWGRGSGATYDVPLAAILIPLFIAIVIATVIAEGDWFYVAIFAMALPLVVLTRFVLAIRSRRHPRQPKAS